MLREVASEESPGVGLRSVLLSLALSASSDGDSLVVNAPFLLLSAVAVGTPVRGEVLPPPREASLGLPPSFAFSGIGVIVAATNSAASCLASANSRSRVSIDAIGKAP